GQVELERPNDRELAAAIREHMEAAGVEVAPLDREAAGYLGVELALDHGALVPLYYLDRGGVDLPLVSLTMALLPPVQLYRAGLAIREAAAAVGRRVAVVASGDLSHRLIPGAPAGYHPEGARFDREIVEYLRRGDAASILGMDEAYLERAWECGYRPLVMMLGSLDGYAVEPSVLSYEGPFGVGYAVAVWKPIKEDAERALARRLAEEQTRRVEEARRGESAPVALARRAVEEYVRTGRVLAPPDPAQLPPELRGRRAGVFVSIKKHGRLRGCIGTVEPTQPDLAREIIRNAIEAATRDPRFDPVQPEELVDLVYSVDVLGEPERIPDISYLDPRRYGVIVSRGLRRGLLLPDLEGIDTAEEQVAIARQKAGLGPDEEVTLERFEVIRYK
ncbi:MAG: AmmeMemoRadiSam system protein A, partial [Bacillota bacterium]|nr:AmmeMemoRadiSam system protein A [Bacillota bacterium]